MTNLFKCLFKMFDQEDYKNYEHKEHVEYNEIILLNEEIDKYDVTEIKNEKIIDSNIKYEKTLEFIKILSKKIENLYSINTICENPKHNDILKSFGSEKKISVSIEKYLIRIIYYINANYGEESDINSIGCNTTLISYYYMMRLSKKIPITQNNVHKILLATFHNALIFTQDENISRETLSQIFGISLKTLEELTINCLILMDFNLFVKHKIYDYLKTKYH